MRARFIPLGSIDAEPSDPALLAEPVRVPDVATTTLGGFRLFRRGVEVDSRQWQSRKARTVLKSLVTRRGAPTHRDVLIDVLWPGDVSQRSSNRLSQTLSTLRWVLDC